MSPADHQALVDDLVRDEGERLTPYLDTVGKTTIGVGRNLTDVGISHAESMLLLENDILRAIHNAETFPWFHELDAVRARAIVNWLFNCGLSKARLWPDFIHAMAVKNYHAAHDALLDSSAARSAPARYQRLAAMIETGHEAA